MTNNGRTMTVKLTRIEVCDLLLACTACMEASEAKKWSELHDKLMAQLDEWDAKNAYGVFNK